MKVRVIRWLIFSICRISCFFCSLAEVDFGIWNLLHILIVLYLVLLDSLRRCKLIRRLVFLFKNFSGIWVLLQLLFVLYLLSFDSFR